MSDSTKINVLVTVDADVGIELVPHAPLADVPPHGHYETKFVPQVPVTVHQIGVADVYRLDEVEVGDARHLFELLEETIWDASIDTYQLQTDVLVVPGQEVRLRLVNISGQPQRPRGATLVKV